MQSIYQRSQEELAWQCAPVFTGVKISNLLILPTELTKEAMKTVGKTGNHCYPLMEIGGKDVFLIYHPHELEAYLYQEEVIQLLTAFGYRKFSFREILEHFRSRYQRYRLCANESEFPHEIGLLLGYPIDDVIGFVEKKGLSFLYSGYWKVYHNVPEKKLLFKKYEQAKEEMLFAVEQGIDVLEVIYQKNHQQVQLSQAAM